MPSLSFDVDELISRQSSILPDVMKKRCLTLGLALLAAPPVALGVLGAWLLHAGAQNNSQKADAIIIFGARVNSQGEASPILRARTWHAFELWKKGLAPRIVCTGGVGTYPPAEAVIQKQLLEKWGVPSDSILVDDQSRSTAQNAVNAAALLPKGAKIIAVSEAFHLWRCRRDCAKLGLVVFISAEAPGWEQLRARQKLYYTLREALLVTRDLFTFS